MVYSLEWSEKHFGIHLFFYEDFDCKIFWSSRKECEQDISRFEIKIEHSLSTLSRSFRVTGDQALLVGHL